MRRIIRVAFADYSPDFNPNDNVVMRALRLHYDVVVDAKNPEFLFFWPFGTQHLRYPKALRIYISGEPTFPDFHVCDYAFSNIKYQCLGRVIYMPSALSYFSAKPDLQPLNPKADCARPFCSFIYSNEVFGEGAKLRKEVCQYIMDHYAFVHCPGHVLHNCEADELSKRYEAHLWHKSKLSYMSGFKFNIAYENHNIRGYITEKLIDCFASNTVPIYFGSEGDLDFFPREAMICAHDYPDKESLLNRIKEVNENDELYLKMLQANPYRTGGVETSVEFFARTLPDIIEHGTKLMDRPKFCAVENGWEYLMLSKTQRKWVRRILTRLFRIPSISEPRD